MQRSPTPCSWPHSKHDPALPSISEPGASSAAPAALRYWNEPSTTAAIDTPPWRSSTRGSPGPARHTTSLTLQPWPRANRRTVNFSTCKVSVAWMSLSSMAAE